MTINKNNIAIGALWTTLSSGFSTVLKLISVPIMARLLLPEDFGNVAVPMGIITLTCMMLGQGGFGASIIYFEKEDHIFRYTVFWLKLLIGVSLFAITILWSKQISDLVGLQGSEQYLSTLAIIFPIYMISSTGYYILLKEMKFHIISRSMIISTSISTIVGLSLAFAGYGAWSLVVQTIVFSSILCLLYYLGAHFVPKIQFSIKTLRIILPYAARWSLSDGFSKASEVGPLILVSRLAGVWSSGVFSISSRLAQIPREMLSTGLENALFSGIVSGSADKHSKREALLWAMKVNIFVTGGAYCGLAAISSLVVPIVLGPQYAEHWGIFYWLCVGMALMSPTGGFFSYLKSENKLGLMLWLAVLRTFIILAGVIFGWMYENTLIHVVIGITVSQLILLMILLFTLITINNLKMIDIAKYLLPPIIVVSLVGIIMGSVKYIYLFSELNEIVTLAITVLVGAVVFLVSGRSLCPKDYSAIKYHLIK